MILYLFVSMDSITLWTHLRKSNRFLSREVPGADSGRSLNLSVTDPRSTGISSKNGLLLRLSMHWSTSARCLSKDTKSRTTRARYWSTSHTALMVIRSPGAILLLTPPFPDATIIRDQLINLLLAARDTVRSPSSAAVENGLIAVCRRRRS